MHVFPLAQGYKSEPTENFTLCCRFIGAPANSSGRKWEEKQSHSAAGSQLSGSCGLPMAKIHRHQKPASCPWKGELMLACNPGKCSHIASRDREVWEISSCLCMVCDLDRIVSLDGPSCFSTAGKLQWQNTWSALQCGFFRIYYLQFSPRKLLGCLSIFTVPPFNFLEVYKPLEGHLCQQCCCLCPQQCAHRYSWCSQNQTLLRRREWQRPLPFQGQSSSGW